MWMRVGFILIGNARNRRVRVGVVLIRIVGVGKRSAREVRISRPLLWLLRIGAGMWMRVGFILIGNARNRRVGVGVVLIRIVGDRWIRINSRWDWSRSRSWARVRLMPLGWPLRLARNRKRLTRNRKRLTRNRKLLGARALPLHDILIAPVVLIALARRLPGRRLGESVNQARHSASMVPMHHLPHAFLIVLYACMQRVGIQRKQNNGY